MTSSDPSVFEALLSQWHLITIAGIGGIILFAFSVVEHFNRSIEDKLSTLRYVVWFLFLLFGLPFLGILMESVYILNGDKLSAMLSFQVGLTSPAIVKALMSETANQLKNSSVTTESGQ